MKRTHQILGYGLSAVAAAVSAQLHAQSAGLEEIVVTAQKREETAQEIPIAIDVITGDTFIREGVRDMKDIGKMSTELEINSNVGQATVIGLRGMQTTGFAPTGDTLTAVHMDGAFLSSFYGLNGIMFDLERVEVLAGPQGTLYGRNAAAGAINLITKKPGRDFEANGTVDFGSENLVRIGGGVTVPVSDTLSLRFAGQKFTRDSFFTDGSGEQDQWGGRISAQWTPNDTDTLLLTFDKESFGGTNDATTLYAVNAAATASNGVTTPASVTNYLGSPTLNDPYNNKAYWAQRNQVFVGRNEQTSWGGMAQYAHEFESFTSTLQYSHRELEGVSRNPYTTPNATYIATGVGNILPNVVTSDTAELRFTSNPDNGAFEWVGGFFYVEAENLGWNATAVGATPGNDPVSGLNVDYCPCSSGYFPNSGEMYSYAAFGQTTWTPESMDRLHVTVGLRYTFDWKSGILGFWANKDGTPQPIFGFGTSSVIARFPQFALVPDLANGDNTRTWDGFQYKLGAEYELTDSSMVYGSISTGYKSGGITFGTTPVIKPEELLAFEIGTKNRFLDNTLQFNSSMWFYKYSDMEANVPRNLGFTYFNAATNSFVSTTNSTASVGKVDLGGVSADIDWLFTDNDQLGLSFTHVYSKVKDGTEVAEDGTVNQILYVGQRIGDGPKWQAIGRYGHTFNFANGSKLDPQVKYQWQSKKYDGATIQRGGCGTYNALCVNPGQTTIPSQGITDVSLRFTPSSESWDITGYVNNVTDELNIRALAYDNNWNNTGATQSYGHVTATLGEPRTYGVVLTARFK